MPQRGTKFVTMAITENASFTIILARQRPFPYRYRQRDSNHCATFPGKMERKKPDAYFRKHAELVPWLQTDEISDQRWKTIMPLTIYIDGNNLLHAMRASALVPNIGRETMVRRIEEWVTESNVNVVIFFDGPKPRGAMGKQMDSQTLCVKFSAPRTADDLLIDAIRSCPDPSTTEVVTSDTAILHEAGIRRCVRTKAPSFIERLFSVRPETQPDSTTKAEKPCSVSQAEAQELLDLIEDAQKKGKVRDLDEMGF